MTNTTVTHEEKIASLLAKLPAAKCCPRCHKDKDIKEGFGLRTSYRGEEVIRVQVQSYCRDCRSKPVKPAVVTPPVTIVEIPAPVVEVVAPTVVPIKTWHDAVLVALGGSQPVKLADLYTAIAAMPAMAERLATNKVWQAAVRRSLQELAKKGQTKNVSKGVWQLAF